MIQLKHIQCYRLYLPASIDQKCAKILIAYFLHLRKKKSIFYEVCMQSVKASDNTLIIIFIINLLILDSSHAFWLTLALPSFNLHEYVQS